MKTTILVSLFLLLTTLFAVPALLAADEPTSFATTARGLDAVAVERMLPIDNDVLDAVYADDVYAKKLSPGLWRFAEPLDVYFTSASAGTWDYLEDGSRLWRLRVSSPGATSLNLGLARFDVPPGARLWLYGADRELVQGPYTAADRTPEGQLWTALVPHDEVVVELHLPAGRDADVVIHRVNHGFRGTNSRDEAPTKQGNCQNDVVCDVADPWRDQVRSVAWYTLEGIGTCSGALMNNTARDQRPFFLSAEHCEITRNNASSMVVYWNYESPTCGRLAGGNLRDNQTGATFRAAYRPSDMVLVELKQKPKASSNAYYAGWNAVNQAPQRAIGIHHPNLDEKAISFNNRRLRADGPTHWEIVWNNGTTEPGSSGSCIFDNDGLCVGTLTGGSSFCHDPQGPDYYGRFAVHFTGGGARGNSLKPWLDPSNTGAKRLTGLDPSTGGGGGGGGGTGGGGGGGNGGSASCQANNTTLCLKGNRFSVTVDWQDANGKSGRGKVAGKAARSGAIYFSNKDEWDLLVKVHNGCRKNNRYWVSVASTSDIEYTVKVTDTLAEKTRTFRNALGQKPGFIQDKNTFNTCP